MAKAHDDPRLELLQGGTELVAIVSQSVAQGLFSNGEAVNRHVWFSTRGKPQLRRIVGIIADVDDEHVLQEPTMTVYLPIAQLGADVLSRGMGADGTEGTVER